MPTLPQITSTSTVYSEILGALEDAVLAGVIVKGGYIYQPGTIIGQETESGEYTPWKRSNVAVEVADPTLVTSLTVLDGSGFLAGNVVNIVDEDDGETALYANKTIESVSGNVVTFTAALGDSTAIAVGDFIELATADGANVPIGISLDAHSGAEPGAIRIVTEGTVNKLNVPNADTFGADGLIDFPGGKSGYSGVEGGYSGSSGWTEVPGLNVTWGYGYSS